MTKAAVPEITQSSELKTKVHPIDLEAVSEARRMFLSSAVNMSWQLAVVVLIPIVGGFKLDQHFHLTPLLTIVGFVLAMLGMAMVLWRQLQLMSPPRAGSKRGPSS